MKNYEEMAKSVLKRRDIEIENEKKRRRKAFLIGAPCAAAVLVGVVGISAVISQKRGRYINPTIAAPDASSFEFQAYKIPKDDVGNDTIGTSAVGGGEHGLPEYTQGSAPDSSENYSVSYSDATPEIAPEANASVPATTEDIPMSTAIDIAIDLPVEGDDPYFNPNAGQNDIRILDINEFSFPEIAAELDENDFNEYSLEALDSSYHLRFNRLGQVYTTWDLSYDRLGMYRHEESDGFAASLTIVSSLNTLNYTDKATGARVSVSAQYNEFTPVSKERLSCYKPVETPPLPDPVIEYDEHGNVIGASTPAYDPGDVRVYPDEGASVVNGYEALIYRSADGRYLADIDMSSNVRIIAEGLSEEEFLKVLDDFTR